MVQSIQQLQERETPMHHHVALSESRDGHATAHKYERIISRVTSAAGREGCGSRTIISRQYGCDTQQQGLTTVGFADCAQQKQMKQESKHSSGSRRAMQGSHSSEVLQAGLQQVRW